VKKDKMAERIAELEADLAEFKQMEDNGLLVFLPCKVGDTVYAYSERFIKIAPYVIETIQLDGTITFFAHWVEGAEAMEDILFNVDDIDETIFLTEEAAEEFHAGHCRGKDPGENHIIKALEAEPSSPDELSETELQLSDTIEVAVALAGYEVLDARYGYLIARHGESDTDFKITIEKLIH
jgi:hypothetical protein